MSGAGARAVLAQNSKSFALAARLLPRACRDDVAVLYAYCRRADDAVDEAAPGEASRSIERLRRELDSILAREAQSDPLLAAFQGVVVRYEIPEEYPRALLDGIASDVGRVRVTSVEELLLYSHRVAGHCDAAHQRVSRRRRRPRATACTCQRNGSG
jgi:phytoene synthase